MLGELGQLVDGRRSIEVERDEKGTTAFFLEAERELGGGGGFTGTVEAAEEDVSGGVEIDGGLVAAEEVGELVLEDFDDLLAGFDRLKNVGALSLNADVCDELLDDAEFDIRLEQGEPNFAQRVGDILLRDLSDTTQVAE